MNKSLKTIRNPEFINVQGISNMISSCFIKVMYIGENRNGSSISKEVAVKMAETLRGNPIVGYYRENKGDYTDHGDQMTINDEGLQHECLTKPYGFVAPNAKVWFQFFDDYDENGKVTTREYLMTEGFLWTGQYPECKDVINSGRPQSMELNGETIDGKWTKTNNGEAEFFIINDAEFTKLCILGNDTEPCFEGASIVSNFTKEDSKNLIASLYTMMEQLKEILEGGQEMPTIENTIPNSETETQETPITDSFSKEDEDKKPEEFKCGGSNDDKEKEKEKFKCGNPDDEEKKKYKKDEEDDMKKDEKDTSEEEAPKKNDEEDKKKEKTYSLEEYNELQDKYTALETEYNELKTKYTALSEFKNEVDNKEKDNLINQFYMLSEEDKKDVIENKSKYTLEQIEEKLSVICFRKKVNFDLNDTDKNDIETEDKNKITTFSLDSISNNSTDSAPAWFAAVENWIAKNK